ncbi:MAG: FeS-binding protein [Ignavibacteria bacterium]|jgi:epoxyqueuosine reductase|nr:FeS-binding protein [Ignavibacteria bacterium]MCU7504893.1 FeS-binding protein [Ignavibacteria bacterium]MCU7517850.1 FeS-binding protein [Ignavibacteria bacterium]
MDSEEFKRVFNNALKNRGFKGSIISAERLKTVGQEINRLYQEKVLDPEFSAERLSFFNFTPSFPDAKIIILTASPQPQKLVSFSFNGRLYNFTVPPTYAHETDMTVEELLHSILGPEGYHIIWASLPVKLLAVHSGLAEYGRNNITYIPGMGSFFRLVAYFSDFPAEEDGWRDLKMMKRCETCTACVNKCPSGAIPEDRFLLHAEKCLTFHNEREKDFPEWLDLFWHNSLIGCMQCQRICPENKAFANWTLKSESFSEEETSLILDAASPLQLPDETIEKLDKASLLEDLPVVSRNLKTLLEQQSFF